MITDFVLHTLAIDAITYLIALKEGIQHSVKEMIGVATLGELRSVMYVQEHANFIFTSLCRISYLYTENLMLLKVSC